MVRVSLPLIAPLFISFPLHASSRLSSPSLVSPPSPLPSLHLSIALAYHECDSGEEAARLEEGREGDGGGEEVHTSHHLKLTHFVPWVGWGGGEGRITGG